MTYDNHEICRARILKIESDLESAHETIADLELDLAEKDALISDLSVELKRLYADRNYAG